MGRVVALREDFDGPGLRGLAKASKDAGQSRRLLALAEIYDGGRRKDAARIGDVGLQVIRDWVLRFNAKGPAGLIDGKAWGQPPKLNDEQRQALARIVDSGPIPSVHGVVRWRRKDLALWIYEEYGVSLEESSVGRELRALGFVKISARPRHHGQNEFAIEDFKKTSPARWRKSAASSRLTPP
jgi:transposase